MTALPSTRELRALDLLEVVPAGCAAVLVRDRRNLPHLRPGELAVIDLSDREPVKGELFAIRYSRGPVCIMETVQHACGDWWCYGMNRPRSGAELDRWIAERRELVAGDGPYEADGEHLRSKLVGRVIGVMVPG